MEENDGIWKTEASKDIVLGLTPCDKVTAEEDKNLRTDLNNLGYINT